MHGCDLHHGSLALPWVQSCPAILLLTSIPVALKGAQNQKLSCLQIRRLARRLPGDPEQLPREAISHSYFWSYKYYPPFKNWSSKSLGGFIHSPEHLLSAAETVVDVYSSSLACVKCLCGLVKLFLFRQSNLLTHATSLHSNDLQLLRCCT